MNRYLRRSILAPVAVLASLTLAACGEQQGGGGGGGAPEGAGAPGQAIQRVPNAPQQEITVGSKDFEEQFILGEIYAQALRAAGYKTKTDLDLGDAQTAYKALQGGEIDMYPEYLGTALTSFYDVKPEDVPSETDPAYQQTKQAAAKDKVAALTPTPFQNTFAPTMLTEEANRLGIATLSDLGAKGDDLSYAGFPEFEQRADGLPGLEQTYGIKPKDFVGTEEKTEVLGQDEADVVNFFSTDGELTLPKYKALTDDKMFFPRYNVSLLVGEDATRAIGPQGMKVIEQVQKPMTEEVMQELNSRVVLDKEQPEKVAAAYLKESGFVK